MVDLGTACLPITDLGSGLPVILLHAAVTDRRSWIGLTPYLLEASIRTISYDRRGFGDASADPVPHDPVDDLFAVFDACGIHRAVLVGNSQGGRLAVEAALRRPASALGLVLVCAGVPGAPGPDAAERQVIVPHLTAIDAAREVNDLDTVNELEARLWLDGPTSVPGRVAGPTRELFLAMNKTAMRGRDIGEAPSSGDSWAHLGNIAAPTAVIVGDLDLPHIVRRSHDIATRIPGAIVRRLPGSAHLPALEDPAGFAGELLPFLNGLTVDHESS